MVQSQEMNQGNDPSEEEKKVIKLKGFNDDPWEKHWPPAIRNKDNDLKETIMILSRCFNDDL